MMREKNGILAFIGGEAGDPIGGYCSVRPGKRDAWKLFAERGLFRAGSRRGYLTNIKG